MPIHPTKETLAAVADFHLPRYAEIPNVGLYLNQVAKYITGLMTPFEGVCITESMISNYVKKRLVARPVKKLYDNDLIAYLIFITLAKTVLSMEDIEKLFQLQVQKYSSQRSYDYFCSEFENVLGGVFGVRDAVADVGEQEEVKELLRHVIVTLARKLYLNQCFSQLKE